MVLADRLVRLPGGARGGSEPRKEIVVELRHDFVVHGPVRIERLSVWPTVAEAFEAARARSAAASVTVEVFVGGDFVGAYPVVRP